MASEPAGPGEAPSGRSGATIQPRPEPPPPLTSAPASDPVPGPFPAPVERRAAIIAEARALFLVRGYAPVSMQQIADAVGINKATLYHHFRDKDDLFLAVMAGEIDFACGRIAAAIDGATRDGATTIRDCLERVVLATLDMARCDFRTLFHSLKNEVATERRQAFFAGRTTPWAQLRPVFVAAMARGEIREADPDLYIELFLGMAHSQASGTMRTRDTLPAGIVAPLVAGVFLNGIGTRERTAIDAAAD